MELEREFITRIINNPDHTMATAITPNDLQTPAYRAAFSAVNKLLAMGTRPDKSTVLNECREYDVELVVLNTFDTVNFEYFDRELSKNIQLRRLRSASAQFTELLTDGHDSQEIIAQMEAMLSGSRVEHEHREIRTLYDVALEFGPILEKRHALRGKLVGIPTGFDKLDYLTGGLQPGTYYVGARPGRGKTALMLTMMRAALHAGRGAGLISIESSDIELISRVIAAEGPVAASNLRTGRMQDWEFDSMRNAYERIKGFNGHIYFNTKTDVRTLEQIARRMIKTYGIEVLFIDYLQRVKAPGNSKFEQVANASRAVTDIAKGMGVPVVCLAQTGRVADHEPPGLGHFQYSSAIEQDADVAMVIHEETEEIEGLEVTETSLAVLKNRDGEVGTIPVFFDKKHVRFTEVERGEKHDA